VPQKRRLAAGDPQFGELGLFLGVLEPRVELADRVVAAPEVRSDRILDGCVRGVQGHNLVRGAGGDELEIAIDGLCNGFLGRHAFGRYILGIHGDTGGVHFIERIASREIYRNPWLVLREDDIRRPDGSPGIYSVVDKETYALVMPYDGHRFRLVEQFRYPVGARRWEFPQGTAPDLAAVEPAVLAARELREETGLRATSFEALGQLDTAPGMSSQRGWVFLATGISEGEADREHEEQDMRSEWFAREDVEQMIRSGVIADAQSIAAYGLFLLHRR
jgi:8-oxo-dGDP phosphatase